MVSFQAKYVNSLTIMKIVEITFLIIISKKIVYIFFLGGLVIVRKHSVYNIIRMTNMFYIQDIKKILNRLLKIKEDKMSVNDSQR